MKRPMTWMLLSVVAILSGLSTGCYKQQYDSCKAELDNCQALFDGANKSAQQSEADRLRLEQDLQRAMRDLDAERTKAPAQREKGGLEQMGGVYDASKGTITVTIESNILFDSGSTVLKSKSMLSQIAGVIQREHAGKDVWVVGHTDTDPIKKSKWTDNWQLSTERSLAVVRQLMDNGIPAKQLVAAGRGQYQPAGSVKEKNRRVEIIVFTR